MKLLQITGTNGGDTVLVTVPDEYDLGDVVNVLGELESLTIHFVGEAVREVEVELSHDLAVEYYAIFVRVD